MIGTVLTTLRRAATAVLLAPVHLWRATVVFRQPRCRYYPSCSTYAVEALRVHGPLRGTRLATGRVLRCHPWSLGGIDEVPPASHRPSSHQASPDQVPRPSVPARGARDA